jgi:hypothetical protein
MRRMSDLVTPDLKCLSSLILWGTKEEHSGDIGDRYCMLCRYMYNMYNLYLCSHILFTLIQPHNGMSYCGPKLVSLGIPG